MNLKRSHVAVPEGYDIPEDIYDCDFPDDNVWVNDQPDAVIPIEPIMPNEPIRPNNLKKVSNVYKFKSGTFDKETTPAIKIREIKEHP